MTPSMIPLLLCGAFLFVPFLVGTGAFYAWVQFTNKIPSKDTHEYVDPEGRKHIVTDWAMLTRAERRFKKEPEVKE